MPLRQTATTSSLSQGVTALLEAAHRVVDESTYNYLESAAHSDQSAWEREFGVSKDVTGLKVERNVFRYVATPVEIRYERAAPIGDLLRVLLAAKRTNAPINVSVESQVSAADQNVHVESRDQWINRMRSVGAARVRLIGVPTVELARAIGGNPDVAIHGGTVTPSGRIEMLPFLREQSISITAHRFGNVDPGFADLRI